MRFDFLGAEEEQPKNPMPANRAALTLGAGILGALIFRKHPVLGFIGASTVVANTHAVYQKDKSPREALQRVGQYIVGIAGALALPKHPALAFGAAFIAADALIDGDGGGVIEEWAKYGGVKLHKEEPSTALVKGSRPSTSPAAQGRIENS